MKKHIISVMLIAGTVALCGCSANNGTSSDIQSSSQSESQQTAEAATSKVETAEAPAESSVLADLTGTYDDVSEKFEFSDGWSNGSMFNCTWRKSNGSIFDGSMKLTIDKDLLDKPPYSGAEFRSPGFLRLRHVRGRYEADKERRRCKLILHIYGTLRQQPVGRDRH